MLIIVISTIILITPNYGSAKMNDPQKIVSRIFALYKEHGHQDYIGEPVSQLEHMSQAAALAEQEGYDDEVILAAFFHDIGHLCTHDAESMDGFGTMDHEEAGSRYLKQCGFSDRLVILVKSHVEAKRYLTFKYPDYYEQLSAASKRTLEFQGGRMTAEEALRFEQNPDKELIIRLRQWDDQAKVQHKPTNNIGKLKTMAINHLRSNTTLEQTPSPADY